MATSAAIVEGERNVVITAETNNSVIITGDGNTVHMHQSADGALLAHEYRWTRPRHRARDNQPTAPPRFECHVDREDEVRRLVGDGAFPRVVNLYGDRGVGKTYVLVAALNHAHAAMRDGTIYLDARDRDADDILHAVFGELFDSPVPIRDPRIARHLAKREALVAIEDAELASDGGQRLALGAPRCRLFLTSRRRVLFDGTALALEGLAREHAATIAEQELGRRLSGGERAPAEAVGVALRGQPLQLRQTFSRVREQGLALESLAPKAAHAWERSQELAPGQRDVARTLAVHGSRPVGVEHIEALAGGPGARAAAEQLRARHDARAHSPRYSLLGGLEEAFDDRDLAPETDRALEYFTGWAETEAAAGRHDRVLAEATALLELLRRANRTGRHAQAVRLGLAIEWPLAWGNRWSAWGHTLELVLSSARAIDNRWAEGWALHELATRQYGLGNASAAVNGFQQALALRERIGDGPGADATRQNLRVAGGPPPLLQRLSHLSLAVAAVMAVLLVGAAGVAGAQIIGGDEDPDPPGGRAALVVGVQGKGTVLSTGGSIRCAEAECRKELEPGTEVLLRAEAQNGSQFSRWTGDCSGRGACRLAVKDTTNVVGVFKPVRDPQSVTVNVQGAGTVVSYPAGISCKADRTCHTTFKRSLDFDLTGAAAPGHRFVGWSGDCVGTERCRVEGGRPTRLVQARFVADDDAIRLSVDVRGPGMGRVVSRQSGIECGELCAASFERGTEVALAAIPARGSHFTGWSHRACAPASGEICTTPLDGAPRDVVARFDIGARQPPPTHELELFARGANGTVSTDPAGINDCSGACRASFPEGEVLLTASPREGYEARWSRACAGSVGNVCEVDLDEPKTALASFARKNDPETDPVPDPDPDSKTHRLTTTVVGGGSIDPNCPQGCARDAGEKVIVRAVSGGDVHWDGCHKSLQNTCTVVMNRAHDVTATFVPG